MCVCTLWPISLPQSAHSLPSYQIPFRKSCATRLDRILLMLSGVESFLAPALCVYLCRFCRQCVTPSAMLLTFNGYTWWWYAKTSATHETNTIIWIVISSWFCHHRCAPDRATSVQQHYIQSTSTPPPRVDIYFGWQFCADTSITFFYIISTIFFVHCWYGKLCWG